MTNFSDWNGDVCDAALRRGYEEGDGLYIKCPWCPKKHGCTACDHQVAELSDLGDGFWGPLERLGPLFAWLLQIAEEADGEVVPIGLQGLDMWNALELTEESLLEFKTSTVFDHPELISHCARFDPGVMMVAGYTTYAWVSPSGIEAVRKWVASACDCLGYVTSASPDEGVKPDATVHSATRENQERNYTDPQTACGASNGIAVLDENEWEWLVENPGRGIMQPCSNCIASM
jgi:hypothetical protein